MYEDEVVDTAVEQDYQDETIVCKECGEEFVFTAGEQRFYAEKGFMNKPKACKACRDKKKAAKSERQYYEGICADCGAVAKLTFRPSEDRPVYCSACFEARKQAQAE